MHVVVERRTEAVEEGDGAEPRARGRGCVDSIGDACGSAQQSLDLIKEDLREGVYSCGPVGKHAAQALGDGDHPLPHGHRWDHVIRKVGGSLGQARHRLDRLKPVPLLTG
jgi:hypothetical protein